MKISMLHYKHVTSAPSALGGS